MLGVKTIAVSLTFSPTFTVSNDNVGADTSGSSLLSRVLLKNVPCNMRNLYNDLIKRPSRIRITFVGSSQGQLETNSQFIASSSGDIWTAVANCKEIQPSHRDSVLRIELHYDTTIVVYKRGVGVDTISKRSPIQEINYSGTLEFATWLDTLCGSSNIVVNQNDEIINEEEFWKMASTPPQDGIAHNHPENDKLLFFLTGKVCNYSEVAVTSPQLLTP